MNTMTMNTRHSGLLDRKYREFFIPTILMAMTTTMSIVVDSIIVGNMLGADALAAVNLALPVMMVYTSVAVMLGFGAATIISVSFGKRQTGYAREIFSSAIVGMIFISVLLVIGQSFYLDSITNLLTKEPSLRPLVHDFLEELVYGAPLIILPLGLVYSLRADGWVKMASAMLITSNLVNLALDLLYMGPFGMGISGSSLATVSGYAVGGLFFFAYAKSSERNLGFNPAICLRPGTLLKNIKEIATTGAPAALSSILITIKILAINTMVQDVAGKTGVIAFSVCLSCLSFASMFISGAAQAMTPIVGVLYGEKDYLGVRFVVKRAAQVLMVSGVVVVLLLEIFPGTVLHLFGVRSAEVIAEGVPAVRIFAVSLMGTCFTFLAMFYYMTIGRKRISTAISVVQGVAILVPSAYVLSKIMGVAGIWFSFSLAEAGTLLMLYGCYQRMKRDNPVKYDSILLLEGGSVAGDKVFEATGADNDESVEGIMKSLSSYLERLELEESVAVNVRESVREVLSNVVRHAYPGSQKGFVDVRIHDSEGKLHVNLRDSGLQFDPQAVMQKTADNKSGLGLVKDRTHCVEYSRVIGFNNTTLTFVYGQ